MTQPSQPAKPTNPFASIPRPAPAPPGNAPVPPAQPPAAPAAPPRPSPFSRFGQPRTYWRIVPVSQKLIRFDLNGLGDPFYRLLGRPLRMDLGQPAAIIRSLEAGGEDVQQIVERLNSSWEIYAFKGALLMYPWRKELPLMFEGRVPVPNDRPPAAADNDFDETYDDDKCSPPTVFRALDYTLVLNVLARTRANILLPDAPLGLETQYLNRSVFSDDSRLVALALATGCIEESSLK